MRLRILIATVIAFLLQIGAAAAHSTLVSSDPADGAVLATSPAHFTLTFNEPVSPVFLRLVDDQGKAVTLQYRIQDTAVVVEQPGAIGQGSHALSWRVISADGHPVGGSIVFSVGMPSTGGVPGATETIDWPLRMAIWLCRLALYLGLFVGVGGIFFAALIADDPRTGRRVQTGFLALGLFAIPISVGLQGLDALDFPLSAFDRALVWRTAMGTTWGATAIVAFLALVIALIGSRCQGRASKIFASLALLGVGTALAASGHASAAQPQYLTRPAVLIHTMAVTFWIGALVPLAVALRHGKGTAPLMRFSAAAPFAIGLLLLSGILLATLQVAQWDALWTTDYGRVFLVKLALVCILFLLAAGNRWHLSTRAEGGDRAALRRLVRAIFLEFGLAVAILATVATWRFTTPPRALEAAAALPASVHIHTDKAMAQVTLTPGHAGPVVVSIELLTGDLAPLAAKEVTLILSNPQAGIEPIKRPATKVDEAHWRVDNLVVPIPGIWNVEVAILVTDFDLVRLHGKIDIRK